MNNEQLTEISIALRAGASVCMCVDSSEDGAQTSCSWCCFKKALKLFEDLQSDYWKRDVDLYNSRQEAARLSWALDLILPMAKGYAAAHQVGNNNWFVKKAEDTLDLYNKAHFEYADDLKNEDVDLCKTVTDCVDELDQPMETR